jgi:hypothetical protein
VEVGGCERGREGERCEVDNNGLDGDVVRWWERFRW